MKKFLNSKYGEAILLTAISVLGVVFTIIFYSLPLKVVVGSASLWSAYTIYTDVFRVVGLNVYFSIAFVVDLILLAVSVISVFVKRSKTFFYVFAVYSSVLSLSAIGVGVGLHIATAGIIACAVLSLLSSVAVFVVVCFVRKKIVSDEPLQIDEQTNAPLVKTSSACKIAMIVCEIVSTILMFATLFIPVYYDGSMAVYYTLISTLTTDDYPIYMFVAFMVEFIFCFVGLLGFVATLSFYKSDKMFAQKSRSYMYGTTIYTLVFFLLGYCLTFYNNLAKGNDASTMAYVPFICSVVILIVFSALYGKSGLGENIVDKQTGKIGLKIEPLIYVAVLTLITFSTLFFNVITIECVVSGSTLSKVSLSGFELLKNYHDLESGFQIMSFALTAMLLVSGIMLILSVTSLLCKNKDYYKVIKTSAISNLVFVALGGLFGIYFKIAQRINEENVLSLLQHFNVNNLPDYEYKVSSATMYLLIASLLVIIIMLVRKQFNLSVEEPISVKLQSGTSQNKQPQSQSAPLSEQPKEMEKPAKPIEFDACPAFTELDSKAAAFAAETEQKRAVAFANPSLPGLVRFVVDYARECRLHLSYSAEDIATFVAGLGASRLTILQGMSGTGKTSLPKIFAEAVMGNCEIVEVESSWRDKNELLGYYNEFSKCYTPKKFTQRLYKAKLNPDVLTFIVLDEMNLSRIEYYFSDFLSLMENEENKREIKLLNVKLSRTENGQSVPYGGLEDGHTLKVPENVWFIGTANRDESTFAISDKVYDRAQTMNFNKRAPKIRSFGEPLSTQFVPYETLKRLFEEAKTDFAFEAEDNAVIQRVEKLLNPYNISFGNRILKQMEDFVKIYCACFGNKNAVLNDAVEKILLSKVVSKLENKVVENKESLAAEFDRIGLLACGEFVRKLNED